MYFFSEEQVTEILKMKGIEKWDTQKENGYGENATNKTEIWIYATIQTVGDRRLCVASPLVM